MAAAYPNRFGNSNALKHGASAGGRMTAEYGVWAMMKTRCLCTTAKDYKYYGGRGISVCGRWLKFECFIEDMGPRPSSRHTLERKDNNGNYEPGNCEWATRDAQMTNTRHNRFLTYGGETRTLSDWARLIGIAVSSLHGRLKKGWPLDRALTPLSRRA
jgi:hypothetical protein